MERKVKKEREPQKKKSVAFKATPSFQEDDEDMDEEDEDDFAMVVRKVGRMFYKQGKMSNFRRGKLKGKGEQGKIKLGLSFIAKSRDTSSRSVLLSK